MKFSSHDDDEEQASFPQDTAQPRDFLLADVTSL